MKRIVIAVVIGLVFLTVAGVSYWQMQARANPGDTIRVLAPVRDLDPYTVIGESDVAKIAVSEDNEWMVQDVGEIVGKITTTRLTKGWPIDRRDLDDPTGDYQVVGVNVDSARYSGVQPGDLVDVYWLTPEQGAWNPGQGSHLIAQNARVVRVADGRGHSLDSSSNAITQSVTASPAPAVVYLMVNPDDVRKVISGAAPQNASIALAKKFQPSVVAVEVNQFAETDEEN